MPKRIQMKRTKGWRKPEGAVYVGRPGMFGSPFMIKAAEEAGYTRFDAVTAFADWLSGKPWACPPNDTYEDRRATLLRHMPELRGKDLACWCPLDKPCHADVLLEIANR